MDFKETFDPKEEKDWLEITKDVMGFANAGGGVLVFGIRDKTFEQVGLEASVVDSLKNPDLIMQKVNRHIEPPITQLRCKAHIIDAKQFVGVYIPGAQNKTHVISKDGSFRYPSGKESIVLRTGTIYLRRSAGNKLCDSRDIDEITLRRVERDRESLLSKIARVIESPPNSEVFILSPDPSAEGTKRFIIENSPDSIAVKGMSFTVAPSTIEQEIAGWIALAEADPRAVPPANILWKWYEKRKKIKLTKPMMLEVARFCLISDVPAFYWLQGGNEEAIKTMVLSSIYQGRLPGNLAGTAAFLGKTFFKQFHARLGDMAERLSPCEKRYPSKNPYDVFGMEMLQPARRIHKTEPAFRKHLEGRIDAIAASVTGSGAPGVLDCREAVLIDCYLYAQLDRYIKKSVDEETVVVLGDELSAKE